MGGGPNFPTVQHDDDGDDGEVVMNALTIEDDIKVDEQEGVLDGPDTEPEPEISQHKQELMRELKALGVKVPVKPDYTLPLNEPSWGDSDEEDEEAGEEMDVDEDEDEEDSDGDMEEDLEDDELVTLRGGDEVGDVSG